MCRLIVPRDDGQSRRASRDALFTRICADASVRTVDGQRLRFGRKSVVHACLARGVGGNRIGGEGSTLAVVTESHSDPGNAVAERILGFENNWAGQSGTHGGDLFSART